MNSKLNFSLQQKGLFVTALLVTFFAIGCGSDEVLNRQAISGFVSVDGDPLKHGLIRFVPQGTTAGPGVMAEIFDGTYRFSDDDGPIPGTHRVEIEATEFHGFAIDNEAAFAAIAIQTRRSPLGRNPVPSAYNRNSRLTALVEHADDQKFPFNLRSRP